VDSGKKRGGGKCPNEVVRGRKCGLSAYKRTKQGKGEKEGGEKKIFSKFTFRTHEHKKKSRWGHYQKKDLN